MNDKPFNKFNTDDLASILFEERDTQWDIDALVEDLFETDDDETACDIMDTITELHDKLKLLVLIRGIIEDDLDLGLTD